MFVKQNLSARQKNTEIGKELPIVVFVNGVWWKLISALSC